MLNLFKQFRTCFVCCICRCFQLGIWFDNFVRFCLSNLKRLSSRSPNPIPPEQLPIDCVGKKLEFGREGVSEGVPEMNMDGESVDFTSCDAYPEPPDQYS